MALVHESLYLSDDLADIDLADYAVKLSHQLLQTYSVTDRQIELETELAPIRLDIETAVPCALILNELVANALKHAFPAGRSGVLRLELKHDVKNRNCTLSVIDDGVGLAEPYADSAKPSTLGMRLIHSLTRQLHGEFRMNDGSQGTIATLRFPVEPKNG
jgi:two-component sensor histidine kinase